MVTVRLTERRASRAPCRKVQITTCGPHTTRCQVQRIADALNSSAGDTFWSTLTAALTGALVAALISIALYRHERTAHRGAEIDGAVIALIRAIQGYSRDYSKFIRSQAAVQSQSLLAVQQGWTARAVVIDAPDRTEIDTAIESPIVLTEANDREVAERTREVLYELSFVQEPDRQASENAAVRRIMVAWRAGKRSSNETLSSLNVADERRPSSKEVHLKTAGQPLQSHTEDLSSRNASCFSHP